MFHNVGSTIPHSRASRSRQEPPGAARSRQEPRGAARCRGRSKSFGREMPPDVPPTRSSLNVHETSFSSHCVIKFRGRSRFELPEGGATWGEIESEVRFHFLAQQGGFERLHCPTLRSFSDIRMRDLLTGTFPRYDPLFV